ncbi:WG repeat-containing protein [Clostridium estertheticum]|uniref:WG repeat-containing protein n=1 Tax=Clostridium estertheticum TaxID=238834 RepID=UPI001C6E98E2|nr:WG repeat-containing protein [Clostridium estertheticum]MBW9172916.1 WG repeat-containing protein [Clostridium estertheticum]WLC75244.1 WG repeat-containing protein [Clostridium estertheticum]
MTVGQSGAAHIDDTPTYFACDSNGKTVYKGSASLAGYKNGFSIYAENVSKSDIINPSLASKRPSFGYMDITGKKTTLAQYGVAQNFSSDGLAWVSGDGTSWWAINRTGKTVIADGSNGNGYSNVKPFNDGYAAVKHLGKWGIINKVGKQIIPFIYASLTSPTKINGEEVLVAVVGDTTEYITLDSKILLKNTITDGRMPHEDIAVAGDASDENLVPTISNDADPVFSANNYSYYKLVK